MEKEGGLLVAGKIDVHEAEIFPGFPGHGPPVPPPDGPGKGELAQAGQQILLGAPEGEAVHGRGQGHGPCQAQVHQLLGLRVAYQPFVNDGTVFIAVTAYATPVRGAQRG